MAGTDGKGQRAHRFWRRRFAIVELVGVYGPAPGQIVAHPFAHAGEHAVGDRRRVRDGNVAAIVGQRVPLSNRYSVGAEGISQQFRILLGSVGQSEPQILQRDEKGELVTVCADQHRHPGGLGRRLSPSTGLTGSAAVPVTGPGNLSWPML